MNNRNNMNNSNNMNNRSVNNRNMNNSNMNNSNMNNSNNMNNAFQYSQLKPQFNSSNFDNSNNMDDIHNCYNNKNRNVDDNNVVYYPNYFIQFDDNCHDGINYPPVITYSSFNNRNDNNDEYFARRLQHEFRSECEMNPNLPNANDNNDAQIMQSTESSNNNTGNFNNDNNSEQKQDEQPLVASLLKHALRHQNLQPVAAPQGLTVDLFEHQTTGVSWLIQMENDKDRQGGLLCDEMGVGKTAQMIALMLYQREKWKKENPHLFSSNESHGSDVEEADNNGDLPSFVVNDDLIEYEDVTNTKQKKKKKY